MIVPVLTQWAANAFRGSAVSDGIQSNGQDAYLCLSGVDGLLAGSFHLVFCAETKNKTLEEIELQWQISAIQKPD